MVKSLIGRSQTFKATTKGDGPRREVKRAFSFRSQTEPIAPVKLQKAAEFRRSGSLDPEGDADGKSAPTSPEAVVSEVTTKGVNSSSPPQSPREEQQDESFDSVRSETPPPIASSPPPAPLPRGAEEEESAVVKKGKPSNIPTQNNNEDDNDTDASSRPMTPPLSSPGFEKKQALKTPTSPVMKRSEDIKYEDQKKTKRTPSFTLRRKGHSFKDKYKLPAGLPPAEIEGFLERKQELQSGGKKATIRSWKNMYTVLCGQLLCFFKDKDGKERGCSYLLLEHN